MHYYVKWTGNRNIADFQNAQWLKHLKNIVLSSNYCSLLGNQGRWSQSQISEI